MNQILTAKITPRFYSINQAILPFKSVTEFQSQSLPQTLLIYSITAVIQSFALKCSGEVKAKTLDIG